GIPSLEPLALLTWAAAVTERLRLGSAVAPDRAPEPRPPRQGPRHARPPEPGPVDRRRRARRQHAALPGLRGGGRAPRRALRRGYPAHEAALDRAARQLRRAVLAAQ